MSQPLQVSISANTAEELKAKFIECGKAFGLNLSEGAIANAAPAVTAAIAEPKAKKTALKAVEKVVEEPVANIFDTPTENAEVEPTKEDALAVLKRLNEIKGTKVALEVLKKYDALNISQLKPESYKAFMAEANQTADAK